MSFSSEIVDSSRFSGQNTPENSIFPYLTLGPPTATMNLFPMVVTPRATAAEKQRDESRTMTIFYNGQILRFNDLAPEKFNQILKLAEQEAAQKPPKADKPSNNTMVSDLPIARKASIARFLEKRKDRIASRSPYQAQDVSKQDDNKTWLGLGAQSQ